MNYTARIDEGELVMICGYCNTNEEFFEAYKQRDVVGHDGLIHAMVLFCEGCGREIDRRRISEPPSHLDDSGKWEVEV